MSVEVVNLQGGKAAKAAAALAANGLGFNTLQLQPIVNQTLAPTGGVAPYSFVAVGFPSGIVIGAASGIISGTPTAFGFTSASVTVTDSAAHTISVPVFFNVTQTVFADTLISPPAALGLSWAVGYEDPTQVGVVLPSQCARTATGFQMKNATAGGSQVNLGFLPTVVGALLGQTHFAQMTFVGNVINFPSAGPAVGMTLDSLTAISNGYFLNIEPPNSYQILRTSITHGVVATGIGSPAAPGDVCRISIQYGASANTLIVTINGVVVNTTVDNNALRAPLGSGLPGFFWSGASANSSITCSNWSCGFGL